MKYARANVVYGGFSLVEVMVAVLVISIGLLGIARMQAMALASTGTARLRSLAALEAASLGSTMRANRAYWATSATSGNPLTVNILNAAVTDASDGALKPAAAPDCTLGGGPCTPDVMAAYDLAAWATELNNLLKNNSAAINCSVDALASPVSCVITVRWVENQIAANSKETGTMAAPEYKLYVAP